MTKLFSKSHKQVYHISNSGLPRGGRLLRGAVCLLLAVLLLAVGASLVCADTGSTAAEDAYRLDTTIDNRLTALTGGETVMVIILTALVILTLLAAVVTLVLSFRRAR